MQISNKIKALMLLTKTKQVDIAKKLKTTQANISRIITKDNSMSINELNKIVESVNAKVDIIITLSDGTKL